MNILVAMNYYPFPSTSGGLLYSGNVLRQISRHADKLTVVCLNDGPPDETGKDIADWKVLPTPKPSKLKLLASQYPTIVTRNNSEELERTILAEIASGQYDIVFLNYIAVGWLWQPVMAAARKLGAKRPLVLYMSHNVEADLRRQIAENFQGGPFHRAAAAFDAWRAARLEADLCRHLDGISVLTEEDGQRFAELFHPKAILTFTPGHEGPFVEHRTLTDDLPLDLCVFGSRLSTMKQLVLDALLAEASKEITASGIGLHVLGAMTDQYLAECRQKYPDVHFHGYVENVLPLLGRMRAGIVADHVGGGFKLRILTYIFSRVPMIADPDTMTGLPLRPGIDFVPIENYAQIPSVAREVLSDLDRLNAMQNSAYERCRDAFSWESLGNRFWSDLTAFAQPEATGQAIRRSA